MMKRFTLALPVACTLLFFGSANSTAQERDSGSLAPAPDPVFMTERTTSRQVKGNLLLDTLEDIENTRKVARQTAAEARQEGARLLAFDWELSFNVNDKGNLRRGSTEYSWNPNRPKPDDSSIRIPKPVVLLAIQIQQNPGNKVDSGQGSTHQGLTGDELDLICGPDWIVTWLEDENGNMIPGTAELYCAGESYPLD